MVVPACTFSTSDGECLANGFSQLRNWPAVFAPCPILSKIGPRVLEIHEAKFLRPFQTSLTSLVKPFQIGGTTLPSHPMKTPRSLPTALTTLRNQPQWVYAYTTPADSSAIAATMAMTGAYSAIVATTSGIAAMPALIRLTA